MTKYKRILPDCVANSLSIDVLILFDLGINRIMVT